MFSALTFNMQNGQVWDDRDPDNSPVRLEDTVRFLREQNADVILLQEVERGHDGGAQFEPPPNYQFLRRNLPEYDGIFGYPVPNPLELPFGLGLAIFSKTPLENSFRIDLPPANIAFEFDGRKRTPSHRLVLGARTEIDGHAIRLINTHLQAFFMIKASSDRFHTQRDILARELKGSPLPTLLAGDFNCSPQETLVDQFSTCGFRPVQTTEATWRRMPFVLDHIFYREPLKLLRHEVIPTMASDHHAIRAEFDFLS